MKASPTLLALLLLALVPTYAAETELGFRGYVKLDVIANDYDSGRLPDDSIGRDFHVPSLIPVGDDDAYAALDFHAKESRIGFGTTTTFDEGSDLRTYFEIDFLLSDNGDERISNSYQPRLRHAWLDHGRWRFGQDWTTFMIVTLADDLDFIGTADGMVFGRQALVRYRHGAWKFAIENPEVTRTAFQNGTRTEHEDGIVPDLVGRRDWKGDWGNLALAAIARRLTVDDRDRGVDDGTFGGGLNFGGKLRVGRRDDLRFQVAAGDGLGRYVALNFINDVSTDAQGLLKAIPTVSGFVAYRHHWSTHWRSSFNLSGIRGDNDVTQTGGGANRQAWSGSANLLYSPVTDLTFGAELMRATRELEDGRDGAFLRLQLSARWNFASGPARP
jgi:hypothetical protein